MTYRFLPLSLALLATQCYAAELHGLLDLRAAHSNSGRSFLDGGMGKTRYDTTAPAVSIGQAVLRAEFDVLDTVSAGVELSGDDRHHNVVDVREAWIAWSPVPSGAWKGRVRAGYFFPPTSVEIDYEGPGWTPTRTISSAAINSWIGEELRTNGVEWSARRMGRHVDAPYDVGVVAAVFTGNDPAGTMLAWRGWSISDRIAGRNEALQLADLPVYRADGAIPRQSRTIHPFREIDGRPGYYVGGNLRAGRGLDLAALHYDNRANPLAVQGGQYGWRTRFDHASVAWRPAPGWELLAQAMRGNTLMGANGVALDFRAWYALASRRIGRGTLALRYDRFSTSEHDILPDDPNNEHGHAMALAYRLPLADGWTLMFEYLFVHSDRSARDLIGEPRKQAERSLLAALRWQF
ncbi:hypothetical protein [Pseudoduganella sp. OTU4001]|uniref:hypothetical protein n=1 Tax=Pseudoduganella sp. OTU4001 TaxID=3043854 RepID=UPI00313C36CE